MAYLKTDFGGYVFQVKSFDKLPHNYVCVY